MAAEWDIVIGGTAFPFSSYGAVVTGMQGVGMAPVRNVITNYAISPGGAFQRTKVEPRSVIIQAALRGTSLANLHALRAALIDAVRPDRDGTQQPTLLRYRGGSATVEIEGYYDDGLQWGNPMGYTESLAMRFICPDPYFRGTADSAGTVAAPANQTARYLAEYTSAGWSLAPGLASFPSGGYLYAPALHLFADDQDSFLVLTPGSAQTMTAYVNNAATTLTSTGVARWTGSSWTRYAGSAGLGSGSAFLSGIYAAGTVWTTAMSALGFAAGSIAPVTVRRYDSSAGWVVAGTFHMYGNAGPIAYGTMRATGGNVYWTGNPTTSTAHSALMVARGGSFVPVDSSIRLGVGTALSGLFLNPTTLLFDVVDAGETLYVACGYDTITRAYVGTGSGTFPVSVLRGRRSGAAYTWDSIGTASGSVFSIDLLDDGTLVAAGDFTSINGVAAHRLARYTGSAWEAYGSADAQVSQIRYNRSDGRVYVSGLVNSIDGRALTDRMAYRYGNSWYSLPVDMPGALLMPFALTSTGRPILIASGAGTATMPLTSSLVSRGRARTSPVITISGGGTITEVSNVTTSDRMFFDGLALLPGETLTLDMDARSYTSNVRGNLHAYIVAGSRLSGWGMVPGTNVVTVATVGTAVTVAVTWRDRYWSVDT